MRGYPRQDGRKGIRNYVVVAYLVECAHHVARRIAEPFQEQGAQLIGFPGCYPSDYAHRVIEAMCTHPNVGAVLLVSLGCEEFRRGDLKRGDRALGGGRSSCSSSRSAAARARRSMKAAPGSTRSSARLQGGRHRAVSLAELVVGTKCGGSDGLSGITANPAVGHAFDLLVDAGATVMFEETCELIGCEQHMAGRAVTPELGDEIIAAVRKGRRLLPRPRPWQLRRRQHQGRTLDASRRSRSAPTPRAARAPIVGLLKPGVRPPRPGLYLMDTVNDGPVRYGFPNINDTQTVTEMVASGCQHDRVHDRRRLGRRAGDRAGHQGRVELPRLPAALRRHGRQWRHHCRWPRDDRRRSASTSCAKIVGAGLAASRAIPRRSATRNSSLAYKTYEPLGPACLPG